jgi:DNA-binding CsgD family transcriptional regulator
MAQTCRMKAATLAMLERPGRSTPTKILSGAALIGFDANLRVQIWNDAAEQLTGTRADDALGHHCWDVVRGRAEDGSPFCGPNCDLAKMALRGSAVQCDRLVFKAPDGPRNALVSTITVEGDEPLFVHVICNPSALADHRPHSSLRPQLTPREYEILELLAAGIPPKVIALRLGISVSTARNHIRKILAKLQAQSQLHALAKARSLGIIRG